MYHKPELRNNQLTTSLNQYEVDSFTTPHTTSYHVTLTPPDRQKLGTVNNCTCLFFAKTHSACKHMYVVARRTKYRVSERIVTTFETAATANNTPTTPPMPSPSIQHGLTPITEHQHPKLTRRNINRTTKPTQTTQQTYNPRPPTVRKPLLTHYPIFCYSPT